VRVLLKYARRIRAPPPPWSECLCYDILKALC
jgi:hypothetical protein